MADTPHKSAPHLVGAMDARPEFLVTLGLIPPCTVEDVKQAYLAKVKSAHPDVGGNPAEFHQLQEAYERATEWAKFRASRIAWLGNWVEKYAEQETLTTEIQRRGGQVHVEGVDWLRRSFGDDFSQVAAKIQGIELTGSAVDDNTLSWLGSFRHLLTSLRSISLARSAVTDAGVQHLAAFPSLREVDLSETKISGSALIVLERLPELEWIGLRGATIGMIARMKLKFKYPGLQVET
ncbi:MAG: hypothetical protein IT427_10500 [Pirellulales bacterium]|nr:hypothetical protein [Pirellulales bacterium]